MQLCVSSVRVDIKMLGDVHMFYPRLQHPSTLLMIFVAVHAGVATLMWEDRELSVRDYGESTMVCKHIVRSGAEKVQRDLKELGQKLRHK